MGVLPDWQIQRDIKIEPFADGSVRFVKDTVSPPTWRALGTKAGEEILSSDSY